MENAMAVNDSSFSLKFGKLNEQNQKYILAIQQALLYAQDSEKAEKKGKRKKEEDKKMDYNGEMGRLKKKLTILLGAAVVFTALFKATMDISIFGALGVGLLIGLFFYIPGRIKAGNLKAVVIGINPSKANDDRSDRTLTLTARFLNMYGFTQFVMLNIFESYATKPKDIEYASKTDFKKCEKELDNADIIFIAWGIGKGYTEEKDVILEVLKKYREKLYCVEAKNGEQPLHPRRLSYKSDMVRYVIQ